MWFIYADLWTIFMVHDHTNIYNIMGHMIILLNHFLELDENNIYFSAFHNVFIIKVAYRCRFMLGLRKVRCQMNNVGSYWVFREIRAAIILLYAIIECKSDPSMLGTFSKGFVCVQISVLWFYAKQVFENSVQKQFILKIFICILFKEKL